MTVLNYVFDIFGDMFNLIFFTDIGGINIAMIVGGMLVGVFAMKLLKMLLERS